MHMQIWAKIVIENYFLTKYAKEFWIYNQLICDLYKLIGIYS